MNQIEFLDLINILSFIIGIENLDLNAKQSSQIDEHLHKQDEHLLKKIIEQNDKIIKLLEERL